MEKEKIKQAAKEYAKSNAWCPEESCADSMKDMEESFADAFMDGARWRINSAWHDGTASCEARRKALVLFKNGNAAVYKDLRDIWFEQLWDEVDKFAYLADLLPDTRKEAEP